MLNYLLNKSFLTNFLAALVILIGYCIPEYQELITTIGYFAISGSITNWLAIHMLFEKVPGLYGSGVIPNNFTQFKISIRELILDQFFTAENINNAIGQDQFLQNIELSALADSVNYEKLFESLVEGILESSMGSMLNMFGGKDALSSLKEPVIEKLRQAFLDLSEDDSIKEKLSNHLHDEHFAEKIISKISVIVDKRLDELTPQMIKKIVQDIRIVRIAEAQ